MKQIKKEEKTKKSFRLSVKVVFCTIYLIVVFILAYCAFYLYQEQRQPTPWERVRSTQDYTYIDIDKMSEKFARVDDDKNVHFIIDEEKKGSLHIYLLVIDKSDYAKYKKIIDYSYGRTKEKPESVRAVGYPVKISDDLKELTIKNYKKFVSLENKVELSHENFDEYLTDTYLDTTKEVTYNFNWIVVVLLALDAVLIFLVIITILDKDRLVDEVVELEEKRRSLLK